MLVRNCSLATARARRGPGQNNDPLPLQSYFLELQGDIDLAACNPVRRALAALPVDGRPLVIDLRRATSLDPVVLRVLLEAQRTLSPIRPVSFRLATSGPVRRLVSRLGLEKRLGLSATGSHPPFPPLRLSISGEDERTDGSDESAWGTDDGAPGRRES